MAGWRGGCWIAPGDRVRPVPGDDRIQVPRFALELTRRRTGIAGGQQTEAHVGGRNVDRWRVTGLEHSQRIRRVSEHLARPLNSDPTVTRFDDGRTGIVPHSLHLTTVHRRTLRGPAHRPRPRWPPRSARWPRCGSGRTRRYGRSGTPAARTSTELRALFSSLRTSPPITTWPPVRPAATRRRSGPPARRVTREPWPRVSRPARSRSRGRHRSSGRQEARRSIGSRRPTAFAGRRRR